ncbi:MAG: PQQ-dependent dehydrogenase, methanol/ethanol family [Acidobacteria bacterium]|nr:PQQ-dependent dehydrogenase, methanol/ethanol family [Acidobacteriota bacterium]
MKNTGCAGGRVGLLAHGTGIRRATPAPKRPLAAVAFLAFLLAAGSLSAQGGVSYERLRAADDEPGNWLMYSGQYDSQRFSRLDEINRSNAADLQLRWVHQLPTLGRVETTPLVVDEVMYATTPDNVVIALDARTGRRYWSYAHELPDQLALCCGKQNRGVAIQGDRLYMGTVDAHLLALDAKTGAVIWDTEVGSPRTGHSITAAPMIIGDLVITGIGGGEYGIRGFLDAYDADSGELRWRTYTIPGPGEPGNETWEGDSWKTGGAPTWMTGSYDPELDLLYWGTGNPGPDWNGEVREGDNLHSDSVLAIRPDTGEIVWTFQFTPHDVHDWDACQVPILFDAEYQGQQHKLMAFANRNAFFYLLDRETGEFLFAREFARQTWAEGIDQDTGRPIRVPNMLPSEEGTLVSPTIGGAANWFSPTYSPDTGLFYIQAYDAEMLYYMAEAEYEEGELFVGGYGKPAGPADQYVSAVRALDPLTGDRVWEYRVQPRSRSGLLATKGGLVFGGSVAGIFYALDAETGDELWHRRLGGDVHAAPISYEAGGQQHVTLAAGRALFTFALPAE